MNPKSCPNVGHKRELRVHAAPQQFEIRKNADGSRSVSGYFAKFNVLSHDLGNWFERIAPGAFTTSLRTSTTVVNRRSRREQGVSTP
jgi:phage head maturation protease